MQVRIFLGYYYPNGITYFADIEEFANGWSLNPGFVSQCIVAVLEALEDLAPGQYA